MANDTEIGSISIGISADTSQLKAAFAEAKRQAADFQIPEKTIKIKLSVREPTEADIRKAQTTVTNAMRKAATLKVEIAPTISVKGDKIAEFRAGIAAQMDKTKAIPVDIVAKVDATAIQNQIKAAIGVIQVPLAWYWENGPPPSGATGGGGGGPGRPPPGSPHPPPGAPHTPPPGTTATGRGTGVPYVRPTITSENRAVSCPICGVSVADAARMPDHMNYKHKAESTPAAPVAGQAAGAPAATPAAPVPPPVAATFTKTQAPTNEAEARRNRFSYIRNQLSRGRPKGMSELLKAGARVNVGSGDAAITAKKGSDLAKFLAESVDPDSALGFIEEAIAEYAKASEMDPKAKSDFSSGARSMAGATPVRSDTATNKLRAEIEKMAKERAAEYRNRPDVQAMRAEFEAKGFGAFALDVPDAEGRGGIGSKLFAAREMIAQDPARAREMLVETLSQFFSIAPKAAKKLFAQDPGKGKTGGAGPRTKLPRKIARGTDEIRPAEEAAGAAISALFAELFRVSLPLRDARAKAERQEQIALRKEQGPIQKFGLVGESEALSITPAQAEAQAQRQPEPMLGPRIPLDRAGNPIVGRSIDQFGLKIRQTAAQVAEEERAGRASRFYHIDAAGNRVPGPSIGSMPPFRAFMTRRALGRAGGGPVKAGGLMGRLAKQGIALPEGAYIVGEKGEEVFVPEKSGHIIDNEGKNIPEWLRRSREGRGVGKDLTGHVRAAGGPVRSSGFLARAGRFLGTAAAAAEQSFAASGLGIQGAGVQRVWVVNMPAAGFAGPAQSSPFMGTAGGGFSAAGLGAMGQGIGQALGKAQKTSGRTAGGGGGTGLPRSGGFTALEEAHLQAQREDLITAQRLRQREVAARLSSAIREAPTRGVPTATGEITAINLGGLRGVIERRRLADEAASRATVALTSWANSQKKLEGLVVAQSKATDPKQLAAYTKAIGDQEQAVDFLSQRYENAQGEADNLSKSVISGGDKMRIFAANTTGVVGGMIIFSTLLGAAQAGLQLMGKVLGPVIERSLGYANVTATLTAGLAEQTQQSGGSVVATVAQAEATTGLAAANAEAISPLIERRAATEAGNKAIEQQIDLLHASSQLERQNKGGFDKGLTQGTGGIAGTSLLAIPSTSELLRDQLKVFPDLRRPESGFDLGQAKVRIPSTRPDVFDEDALRRRGASAAGSFNAELEEGRKRLAFFNEQAEKGGETTVKLAEATEAQAIASAKIVSIVDKDLAKVLTEEGLQFEGATGPQDILRFLEAQNVAAQTPDPQLLIRAMNERIVPNQLAAFDEEARQQLQRFIPAQRGLEALANPPLPFGTGITQQQGGLLGGANTTGFGQGAIDPAAIQSFNQYKDVATSALDAVAAKAEEGKAALAGLGVPPELINQMSALGKQAQGIEIGVANRNAAFEAAQYNRQLFVMNRNLADAEALLGRQVGSQGRLGALERENFELGKRQNALQIQAQTLSLELTQRQINFQRAVAGFAAPGLTPEERRANVEQAKIEADFAQKQLNIQKQLLGLGKRQFAVSVDIFGETARRQVADLQASIKQLTEGHQIQLDNKAAAQTLDAIHKQEAQIAQDIGVYIDKAQKKAAAAIGQALDIANKSGEAFGKILLQTAEAWGSFITQGGAAIRQLTGGRAPSDRGQGGGGDSGGRGPGYAAGFFGSVSGATSMIVGEAGTETVAVLRNPRITGVGGGGGIQLNFYGDMHVRSDGDIDTLVYKVVNAMGRQAALKGLRTMG